MEEYRGCYLDANLSEEFMALKPLKKITQSYKCYMIVA